MNSNKTNGYSTSFPNRQIAPASFVVSCPFCGPLYLRITSDGGSIICSACGTIQPTEKAA